MRRAFRFLLATFTIGVLCLYGLADRPASAQTPLKFNLAFAGGPQSFSARAHVWWAEEVERRTAGRVKIELHWGGSLASHAEMVKLVGTGAVDMGESVWAPYNPQIFPLHTVTDGPVIWSKRPMALMYAGMQLEKEIPEVEAENTKANLKRLTWQGAGISNLMMKNKPVRAIADLKGLQIRTAGKFLQPPLMKAVGAVPVGIPMPELYDAMQKGMIAGATGTMGLFLGQKMQEVCKYQIVIGMGGDPGQGIMMNLDKWNQLPQDIQAVFMTLYETDFPKAFVDQFAAPDYHRAKEIFDKNGIETIELSDAEIQKWKSLVPLDKHVEPWVTATVKASGQSEAKVREVLKRYQELADQYEKVHTELW